MQTTFYFIRHGEVDNPQGVYYGRLAHFGLSGEGRRQARAAADLLSGKALAAVYASPLLRARQTAQIIAAAAGCGQVLVSASLNEVYSPFDGSPGAELAARGWDVYSGVPAPYEQPADVLKRALRFLHRAAELHPGGQVAAVTHMDLIQFVTLWAAGYPPAVETRARLAELDLPPNFPLPGMVTAIAWGGGAVESTNFPQLIR